MLRRFVRIRICAGRLSVCGAGRREDDTDAALRLYVSETAWFSVGYLFYIIYMLYLYAVRERDSMVFCRRERSVVMQELSGTYAALFRTWTGRHRLLVTYNI